VYRIYRGRLLVFIMTECSKPRPRLRRERATLRNLRLRFHGLDSHKRRDLAAPLLYGTEPYDSVTFGTVPLVLVATGLVACALPAYRASRVESLVALRAE
jgi:hypothetical protein